jgi:galactose mutarotase-like enzyme
MKNSDIKSQPIKIENGPCMAVIHPHRGGLISSLKFKNEELLWTSPQLDFEETSWPNGGIPLCFPFAGRSLVKDQIHQYQVQGKALPMPIHGFAYAMPWTVAESSPKHVILKLTATEQSHSCYPFSFQCLLTIEARDLGLSITCRVERPSSDDWLPQELMPVALGWHPYFKIESGESAELIPMASSYFPVTPQGIAGKKASIESDFSWILQKNPLLKSLILTDLRQNSYTILFKRFKNPERRRALSVEFNLEQNGSHYSHEPMGKIHQIVLWTSDVESFFCVEPWMSLPDAWTFQTQTAWLKPGMSLRQNLLINCPQID